MRRNRWMAVVATIVFLQAVTVQIRGSQGKFVQTSWMEGQYSSQSNVYGVWWTTNLMTNFVGLASNLSAAFPENVYTDALHTTESENFYRIDVKKE